MRPRLIKPAIRCSRIPPLVLVALAALALALTACGTKGAAPTLGPVQTVRLDSAGPAATAGTITLTPVHAARFQVFYLGKQLPLTGAQTPAQLRSGGCAGPLIAPLTDGNPSRAAASSASATPAPTATAQPAASGDAMQVAVEPSADLTIVVLARRNDPKAPVVACGQPLSGKRQFFDLYPPDVGSNGTARGIALLDPITATRVDVSVRSTNQTTEPTGWEVTSGSCTGTKLGGGPLSGRSATAQGIIFATVDTHTWWAAVTQTDGERICSKVGG
jgi:hypothetical protein